MFRPHARALRGAKVYADIPGKKREMYSIIGGLLNKTFIAPFTFQGGCNAEVFNQWLQTKLIPKIPKGTTIFMDNAAFHKTAKTKEIIKERGCELLFLPTYSPDMNPIEHCWHTLKPRLRKLLISNQENFKSMVDKCLLTI